MVTVDPAGAGPSTLADLPRALEPSQAALMPLGMLAAAARRLGSSIATSPDPAARSTISEAAASRGAAPPDPDLAAHLHELRREVCLRVRLRVVALAETGDIAALKK